MRIPGRVPYDHTDMRDTDLRLTETQADHGVSREPPLGGVVYLDGQCRLEHK